jgi:hypothetical protein
MDGLIMPGLAEFKLLAHYAPYQLHRFAMDWAKQGSFTSVRSWEQRERGSLQAILNAYAYVIPKIKEKKRINLEDILALHKLCTLNVQNLNKRAHKLRKAYSVAFGLVPSTCSMEGVKELVLENNKYPYQLPFLSEVLGSEEHKVSYLEKELNTKGGFYFNSYDGGLTETEREEYFELDISAKLYRSKTARYYELKKKYNKNLIQIIINTLEELYKQLDDSKSEEERLVAIVQGVQRLERIHPFRDCNCRVFCMVFLNTLLMQEGFPPTLLCDPNQFDGYAVFELIQLIRKGFERTQALCDYAIKEKNTPTLFPMIQKSSVEETLIDDEDYLPSCTLWCEVHPIQRAELNAFAKALILALLSNSNDLSLESASTSELTVFSY